MSWSSYWIRNWDKWQTYHRAQPPWIKLHRCVMRDPDWVTLTAEQRGELVSMWLLAADRSGSIPKDPELVQTLCHLNSRPNLKLYEALGFLTKTRRQHVVPETETETETETEERQRLVDRPRNILRFRASGTSDSPTVKR